MRTPTKVVAPVLTFVAVAAVAVTAALVTDGSSPRPLRLAGPKAQDAVAALAPGAGGSYELVGTLPSGTPADAPAWLLSGGPADAGVVSRLAAALHAGTPARDGDGWRAGNLVVSGDAGQSWWWSPCASDTAVSSDGSRTSCATVGATAAPGAVSGSGGSSGGAATPGLTPEPSPLPAPSEPAPVPEATVTTAAAPVLTAVGLEIADAQVSTTGYGGSVTVDRRVGGLEAVGLTTRVDVDPAGTVTGASGWLGAAREGDSYPLISAQQAFDELPEVPRMLMCPVGPDDKGCLEPAPVQVTGAHLGLSLQPLADGGQVLVPSWLFEVKGSTEPVVGVAVQHRFLPTPSPVAPTTTVTDEPAPPPSSVEPAPARVPLAFDAAYRASVPAAVVVQYGDSGSCPHQDVTAAVKESADSVVVLLEADPMQPLVACTEDYRAVRLTVKLQAPLGDRAVIDGSTGTPVPLSP